MCLLFRNLDVPVTAPPKRVELLTDQLNSTQLNSTQATWIACGDSLL